MQQYDKNELMPATRRVDQLLFNTLNTKKLSYRKQNARKLQQYVDGIYSNCVTLKSGSGVVQGHWKWHHSIDRIRVTICVQ